MKDKPIKKIKSQLKIIIGNQQSNSNKIQLIKDGMGSLIVNVGNKALSFIVGVLLLRILGRAEFGIYSYVLSLVYILIIPAEFGISNLIVRETAQGVVKQKPSKVIGVWGWSFKIILILSLGIILVSGIALFWGTQYFHRLELITFGLGIILLPFQALIHLSSAALRGLKEVVLGQLPDLIIVPGLFAILFFLSNILLTSELTAAHAMLLLFLSTFIALLISIVFLYMKTPIAISKAKPVYQGRIWFASALPLGLSSGLNMIKTRVNVIIMGFFVSASQIGTFQVAVSTAALTALVLHATNSILAPQFASVYVQSENEGLQRLVVQSTRVVFAFNLIASLSFVFFGKAVLSFVFGLELVEAYPVLLILIVGQLVNAFVGPVAFLLNMTGYERDVMKVIGLSTIVSVITTLILTRFWGIIGAAISTSISLVIAQILMFRLVRIRLGIISNVFGKLSQ
jgi:O-antigen/teichoic acid export membrane protein